MVPMLQRSVKSEMLTQAGPLTDPSQSKDTTLIPLTTTLTMLRIMNHRHPLAIQIPTHSSHSKATMDHNIIFQK